MTKKFIAVDYDESLAASQEYFGGDELSASVFLNKYALKNQAGELFESTPHALHERMAGELVRIENKYPNPISKEEIMESIDVFKYSIPQGGSMTGIGNPFQISSLSNCFVIGNNSKSDSYGGIFAIDEQQTQLMKRRKQICAPA